MFNRIREKLTGRSEFSNIGDPEAEEANKQDLEALLNNYIETDSADVDAEIVERSPETTPFILVGERNEENYDDSKVHFIFTGVVSGSNESFTPVFKAFNGSEDVYAPDRTGDFSAEHALNGIMDVLEQNPNYQKIEIFAVSVGASIAKILENDPRVQAMNESGREIILTYYDPYDLDDFALGINADKDSVMAKVQRRGIRVATSILPLVGKALSSVILKKGGAIGEDSSLNFMIGQFAALGKTHVVNPETGKFYYEDHISGTIEAGTRGLDGEGVEDEEHNDIFMDKTERNHRFGEAGIAVYLHAGQHGSTEDDYPGGTDTNPPRKNPIDAYRELLEDNNW